MNAEKKLSALNQQKQMPFPFEKWGIQTKISLLKEKWGMKQQFLLSGNEEFTIISFFKINWI